MAAAPSSQFVNREAELGFLMGCLTGAHDTRVIVLKAPPGYGKSGLTDQLRAATERNETAFCVVDPLVLDTGTSVRLHDGYFVQRCAEALTMEVDGADRPWPSFESHARATRWETAVEGSGADLVGMFLADETVRRPIFNYVARLFGFGPYAPSVLLSSDADVAVARCTHYVTSVLARHEVVLVVREAHLIDLYSLRSLLEVVAGSRLLQIILEYTTEHALTPAHEKLLLRYPFVQLCPIRKMSRSHVEHLLQVTVGTGRGLSQAAYASWDGNLRAVQWLSSSNGALSSDDPILLAPRLATSLA